MKIVYTLLFIVVSALLIYLGNKLIRISLVQIQNRRTSFIKTTSISALIMALFFTQFCLLTQTAFPFFILLLLFAATLIGLLLNEIIGAVAGVAIKETRQKVNIMYTATSFQQTLNAPSKYWIMLAASLFLFGGWIAALVVFWSNPLGSTNVLIWAAIFIFVTPQITNIINNLNTLAPIVSSEYIDDDLRNSNLTASFSGIVSSTIYFIFPFFILNSLSSEKMSWMPPYWTIVLIPLAFFVFFGIIPFFIGVYKFKNQKKYFLEWQQTWLQEFRSSVLSSDEAKMELSMNELNEEIGNRTSDNKMFAFLETVNNGKDLGVSAQTQGEQVLAILRQNKDEIIKWDLQLSFIQKLKETRRNLESAKNAEGLKSTIDTRLTELQKDLDKLDKEKNKMAGILTSVITGIIGVLLKTYQSELMALLERFMPR